ncbi:MAG: glycosyltransferase family 2 protein [Bacteroidales bacterium]|nr:glycosyltransferase family 2 protein [Bacteroidales bacterium]
MLVSLVVITYNSSKYVLETLESTRNQTYKDIELIVSDDCSTDTTLELCQSWVEKNKGRFVRTLVTQTHSNMGICGNYNHALSQIRGDYVKYIAGDDILKPVCIERFVALVRPDVYLYFSADEYFPNTPPSDGQMPLGHYNFPLPNVSARKQLRLMLAHHYGLAGPTLFAQRSTLQKNGGFDMRFPMCEDWTIAMKYLSLNLRILSTNERLVLWRIHSDSVSHSNPAFISDLERAKRFYDRKYCLRLGMPLHLYHNELERYLARHKGQSSLAKYIGYMLRCFDLVHIWRKAFPPKEAEQS